MDLVGGGEMVYDVRIAKALQDSPRVRAVVTLREFQYAIFP